jgi:hypothetical protein
MYPEEAVKMRLSIALCLGIIAVVMGPVRADEKAEQELLHAIVQNQVAVVKRLLDQRVNPNAKPKPAKEDEWVIGYGHDPEAPLIVVASRFGNIDDSAVIRLLVAKGANVNAADKFGRTPLMHAAQLAWGPSVNVLLEHGAKVDVRDYEGKTPLMYAMRNRGLMVVAKLLEKGAEVNAKDRAGYTALMHAIRYARRDLIRLSNLDEEEATLPLERGRLTPPQKQTPQSRQGRMAQQEREGRERYLELIRFLIEKGADVNARSKSGDTPLSLARRFGTPEVIDLLQKAGAKD